jgi:hypothetical protein
LYHTLAWIPGHFCLQVCIYLLLIPFTFIKTMYRYRYAFHSVGNLARLFFDLFVNEYESISHLQDFVYTVFKSTLQRKQKDIQLREYSHKSTYYFSFRYFSAFKLCLLSVLVSITWHWIHMYKVTIDNWFLHFEKLTRSQINFGNYFG